MNQEKNFCIPSSDCGVCEAVRPALKAVRWATAIIAIVVMAGCGGQPRDSVSSEEPTVFGPQFKPNKGLLVPEDTRKSLALTTAEVLEQKVPASFTIELRVYDVRSEVCLASGMVSPEKAELLKPGQAFEIRTFEGKKGSGKISRLSDQLQKAIGSIELLVEIRQAPEQFTLGAFAQATIALESSENAVTIPRSALLQCSDGHSVYTISGAHLVRTPVKIGNSSGDVVEIKDGLYAGDQVVNQPVMSLWMTELAAVKGGQACCVAPAKGK
ncbi:MAG: hypothetical protein SFY81_02575 [Verrucomicrobiota bacterium]|nr:hypothetical protein [Verrucomicrobiota bacterium]